MPNRERLELHWIVARLTNALWTFECTSMSTQLAYGLRNESDCCDLIYCLKEVAIILMIYLKLVSLNVCHLDIVLRLLTSISSREASSLEITDLSNLSIGSKSPIKLSYCDRSRRTKVGGQLIYLNQQQESHHTMRSLLHQPIDLATALNVCFRSLPHVCNFLFITKHWVKSD